MRHKTLPSAILPQYLPFPVNPTTYPLPSEQAVSRSKAIKNPSKTATRQAASFSILSNTLFWPRPPCSLYCKTTVIMTAVENQRDTIANINSPATKGCLKGYQTPISRNSHTHTFVMMHGYLKLVYSYIFLNFCQKRNLGLKIKRNHPHESKNSNYSTCLRAT